MALSDLLGLLVAITLAIAITTDIAIRERARVLRQLLILGLVLRVGGGLFYFGLLETAYGGGDYQRYLDEARTVIAAAEDPDRPDFSIYEKYGNRWWGTPAIAILTSWIMRVIGTGAVAMFIVYGCISFLGALCFFHAFRNAFPEINPTIYTTWLMVYPSLWFWPSPVGKDGPVLLGIGLAFLGVTGLRGRRNYLMIAAGTFITLAVRPQYALVFMAALVGGILLGRRSVGGEVAKFFAVAIILVGAVYLVSASSDLLGFDVTETEETAEWIDARGSTTAYGGSAFEPASNPLTGLINVLFRPFLWEARGALVLISSLEVLALWVLLYRRRRAIKTFVKRYRRTEAFWISLLFTVALAAAVGMAVGNFGTLVRQRIHLYPFLFLIAASYPARQVVRTRRMARLRAPEPTAA